MRDEEEQIERVILVAVRLFAVAFVLELDLPSGLFSIPSALVSLYGIALLLR